MAATPALLGLEPSFGFGDRLGLATPGHLDALRAHGGPIRGIFAQQSIREMSRTGRTPYQVITAAAETLAEERFTEPWGADADHLKVAQDVDRTADAGFVFYTIDPSDHVDPHADDFDPDTLERKFAQVKDHAPWADRYRGSTVRIRNGPTIHFDPTTVDRAAVKYGRALRHALDLAGHIRCAAERRGQAYEIELSVDETPQPTTPAEHYIIADQCRRAGVKLVSLAPRYMGAFEKGVDFKGDRSVFETSLADHAAIARELGPYKLSLHSGSDKLSIYAIFARATSGRFHVKTAGTSYLEALRVVARHDRGLLRQIIDFARSRYDADKATYHVSATVGSVVDPSDVPDQAALERLYLGLWEDVPQGAGFAEPGRQILHCTFGSVLRHERLGAALKQLLAEHPQTHRDVLKSHFGHHLAALRSGI